MKIIKFTSYFFPTILHIMKLTKNHLLFLILFVVIVSHLGLTIRENFETKKNEEKQVGISRNQIPEGDEDLYIKKSEIVPPVCPKCPDVSICREKEQTKCPPCPPCGRCPEPAFECKKVPNYKRSEGEYLPRPVLNDFSQFGM